VSARLPQRAFAACSPGLEPALARELDLLGLTARAVPGGVEAEGPDAWAVACLGSRAAEAVKARLWAGPASGLPAARRDLGARLPGVPLEARTEGGRATLSADAAGVPLWKRGYRARIGAAPLRESLAAGLLLELGFDGSTPFLDPMCGSGTIAIEAALLAERRAPGLDRTFAFEGWPGHDAARTARLRERFRDLARPAPAPILGSDRNGGAVRLAGKNAEAAGVAYAVRIERRDAAQVEPPPGPGTCLVNPPYGIRIDHDLEESWRALGALLGRLRGWTVGVLAPASAPSRLLPGRPDRALEVQNGGIRCRLLVYRP
jgi:putative N6-adenine-specific DNA methylase